MNWQKREGGVQREKWYEIGKIRNYLRKMRQQNEKNYINCVKSDLK